MTETGRSGTTPEVPRRLYRGLNHAVFGASFRRTLVGLSIVVAFLSIVAIGELFVRLLASGVSFWLLAEAVDLVRWLTIVVAVLSTFVIAVGYALFNGGVVTTYLIAVSPILSGLATRGHWALGVDATLALSCGAIAATIALYVTGYRTTGTARPSRFEGVEDGLLFTSSVTVIGMVALWRFVTTTTAEFTTITLVQPALAVTVVALGYYWYRWAAASERGS
ncbi:hypothetical protein [Natranaeroarchaeum sulfidigenes]|uniref:Putative membrane protein n=1 Tax=Natranaeroarchaeum sulfidigenes TaxID=2784880 RepID=A0A897MLI0_9EURY|nr:hypothetical protein [Natranaeroarchaeum sulfidigenes]QSG03050.1 putative membrane protein [Natranaeroarchaeum sulfidigenes]